MELPVIPHRDLYPVQDNGQYFRTGYTFDNHQVLFGTLAGQDSLELASVWFNAEGEFTRFDTQLITVSHEEPEESAIRRHMAGFRHHHGYRPDTIRIRQFSVPGRYVRIGSLPEHYQEFLDNPDEHDEERQQELVADIKKWAGDGDFVLWWGEDYYLDNTGEVSSS